MLIYKESDDFSFIKRIQGWREDVKAGGRIFRKWEKRSKKLLFSSKIGENLRGIFSQNRRKFEGYFLRKSEKAANKFLQSRRGYPPGHTAPEKMT